MVRVRHRVKVSLAFGKFTLALLGASHSDVTERGKMRCGGEAEKMDVKTTIWRKGEAKVVDDVGSKAKHSTAETVCFASFEF
jgi:hypothetical protein